MSVFEADGLTGAQVGKFSRGPVPSGYWVGNKAYSSADAAVAANTLYAAPWSVEETALYSQLGLRVTAGAVGSCKLGVYSDNAGPATLIAEVAVDIDTTTPGALAAAFASSVGLAAGSVVWLCACFSVTPTVRGYNPAGLQGSGFGWQFGSPLLGKWLDTSGNYVRVTRDAALAYVPATAFFPSSFGAFTFGAGSPGSPIIAALKA